MGCDRIPERDLYTKQGVSQMYNEIIDQHDLYASFVDSKDWNSHLEVIKTISPEAADAVGKYGIGTKVADDGQYDFESGQLLDDLPKDVRDSEAIEKAYDAIGELAKSYARFVCSFEAE
jgi:hypothetical protein